MKLPLLFRIYRFTLSITSYVLPNFAGVMSAKRFLTPTRHPRPYWEKNIIKKGEEKILANDIKSWCWGEGPKILLIHGWNGRGSQLGFFVEPLVNMGFQVIAIDGPAHGDSPGKRTNLGEFAKKIVSIQSELGHLYGVIAHSFGCPVIMVAIDKGFSANKLVLISSPCDLQEIFDRFTQFMNLSFRSTQYFQAYIEKKAALKVKDVQLKEIIAHFQKPILIVHDKNDAEIPYREALKLTEKLKNYEYLYTKGLGHRRILKSPEVLTRVVSFLNSEQSLNETH
ncbi:alpha/beta hydrolase [Legionella brunensis]|uniref:Putative hydrolase n=1 Tax=Legionella brunensis TaxID=29422 RepID=A0A0W0S038_9GAMM|nr:alpha/beta hydrolase [Legionella brunensis]KTC76754.1 putative hydrolase [Legionella brunensis]